ncbi:MAG: SpoIIE family protein phosphatase [Clostridia bacterium]|nr:SpoIIE family protein phosphatase [Clostridia bacterium]
MKKSLLKQIIGIFLIAIFIAVSIECIVSWAFYNSYTQNRSKQQALNGIKLAESLLDDPAEMESPEVNKDYFKNRDILRKVCKSFHLKYMYIKKPNASGDQGIFIYTVASDPEEDEDVRESHPFGTMAIRKFNESELEALNGSENAPLWFENNGYGSVYSYVYPVKDDNGNVVALIGADYESDDVDGKMIESILSIVLSTAVTLLIVLGVLLIIINRRALEPLGRISVSMNSFARDKKQPEPLGIKSHDEIRDIADAYENMSRDILSYIGDIEKMTEERMQEGVQMDVARRIQSGMVPTDFRLEEVNYNAAAHAHPAKAVGGDFYDCFDSDDGVCIVMGDVSGKGISAALFMAMTKTMIREKLRAGMSPSEALNTANDELCAANPEGMFATVFAAVLDTCTGELRYANAGHTRPVIIKNRKGEIIKPDAGIALGLFENAGIIDEVLMLDKGDGIFLYTDGVTEAVNSRNEFYGEKRLTDALAADNAADTVDTVLSSVREFTNGCEQFDDLTVLAVYSCAETAKLSIKPTQDAMDEIKSIIFKAASGSSMKLKIILACEEILTNIVSYSGADQLDFLCVKSDDRLVIRFSDNGCSFDPVNVEAQEKEFEGLDSGGMGIGLVKQITEKLTYRRIGEKNILRMVFKL